MEDQGKRLLLTVAVLAAIYVGWTLIFSPKPPPPPPAPTAPVTLTAPPQSQPSSAPTSGPVVAQSQPASGPAVATGAASQPASVPATAPSTPICSIEKEGAPTWDTPEFTAKFSRCGGTLLSFVLKGPQYKTGEGADERPIDLVRTGDNPQTLPLALQVESPATAGSTNPAEKRLPVINQAPWEVVSQSADQIVFRWQSPGPGGLEVTKTYKRVAGKYVFQLDIDVKNISDKGDKRLVAANLTMFGYQNPNADGRSMFHYAEPPWNAVCYVDKVQEVTVKSLHEAATTYNGDVRWFGIQHQYFLFAAMPLDKDPVSMTCAASISSQASGATAGGVMQTVLDFSSSSPSVLAKGESLKESVLVYAGPKLVDELEAVNTLAGKETKLSAAVDLGWFAIIARPMLSLLKFFQRGVVNWGLAIILLTITIKLLTLYWTQKSMRSMKEMSKLKPELDKLREKHKDDKQRLNTEMMNLYKTHNISPLGGCLPVLLQMPVWFALYRTLGAAAELYRAPFVGWIHDLTAPDPLHIIPISLTGLMFLQAKIAPAAVDSTQQKMMQYMMPAMFGVFSLVFPSGLAIYMFTNTLLGMSHQYYINKTDKKRAAIAAAQRKNEPPPPEPKNDRSSSSGGKGDGPVGKAERKARRRAAKA